MKYSICALLLVVFASILQAENESASPAAATGASAHRGDYTAAPENTIPAILSAVKKGAHQIEIDVKSTLDGSLVLMHDFTVDRTTNGTGKVSDLTLAEIRKLDAGSRFSAEFKGERVPLLGEALQAIPEYILCNVHVHGGTETIVRTAELIAELGCLDNCFVTLGMDAFEEMAAARNAVPSIRINKGHPADSTVTEEDLSIPDKWFSRYKTKAPDKTFNRAIDYFQLFGSPKSTRQLSETVKILHSSGILVNYCCGSAPDEIKPLIEAGVDFILTDNLDVCLKILEKEDKKTMGGYSKRPVFEKIHGLTGEYRGHIDSRLKAVTGMWLIPAPNANPAMIDMFRTRDRERDPVKLPWTDSVSGDVLPWSGEFVGKHLLSSQLVFRMTGNPELKSSIEKLVRELLATQGEDGYMGPFPRERRLTGPLVWDVWGHYHIIMALLMYYDDTGYEPSLNAASKAADFICDTYLGTELPMTNDDSNGEMNYAVIHAMTNIYRRTGKPRYLEMAHWVVDMWEKQGGPEYMTHALAGKPVVGMPAHRFF